MWKGVLGLLLVACASEPVFTPSAPVAPPAASASASPVASASAAPPAGLEDGQALPKGVVTFGALSSTPPIRDGDRTIAALHARIRACYAKGLKDDPAMSGTLQVRMKVAPNGEVWTIHSAGSGLSPAVTECIRFVIRPAEFSPPDGEGVTATLPMEFAPGL